MLDIYIYIVYYKLTSNYYVGQKSLVIFFLQCNCGLDVEFLLIWGSVFSQVQLGQTF